MSDILSSLNGRGVVVVGGSGVLGHGVVNGLRNVGCTVAVVDRSLPENPFMDLPGVDQPIFVRADIRDAGDVEAAYEQVDKHIEGLTAVVNAVGTCGHDQPSEDMSEEDWREVIDVNLSGTFWSCQQAARRMLPTGRGSIVNFSSLAGVLVSRSYRTVHYHAAKAALNSLTKALAVEWGGRGVPLTRLHPARSELGGAPDLGRTAQANCAASIAMTPPQCP